MAKSNYTEPSLTPSPCVFSHSSPLKVGWVGGWGESGGGFEFGYPQLYFTGKTSGTDMPVLRRLHLLHLLVFIASSLARQLYFPLL